MESGTQPGPEGRSSMRRFRYRRSLLSAVCTTAVLASAGVAAAACTTSPLPPCGPVGFTGKTTAHASKCVRVPPICIDRRGRRGRRGLTGHTGARGTRGLIGVQGETGAPGAQGATGSIGFTGNTGDTGLQGLQGQIGTVGPQGTTGTQGVAGTVGSAGPTGSQGPIGNDGPTGPAGSAGSTGPTGAAGANGTNGTSGLAEYAYIYNDGAENVALEDDIDFDSNGVITAGISHAPGTNLISVTNAGDYKVSFSVSSVEPSQFGLFLNGAPVTNSVYGSGAGTQQNTGQAILTLAAGDSLTLRNHTSTAGVALETNAGGPGTNVNASIVIEKLN